MPLGLGNYSTEFYWNKNVIDTRMFVTVTQT